MIDFSHNLGGIRQAHTCMGECENNSRERWHTQNPLFSKEKKRKKEIPDQSTVNKITSPSKESQTDRRYP